MKRKSILVIVMTVLFVLSGCSDAVPNYEPLADQLHEMKPYFSTSENDYSFREAVGIWPKDDDTLNDLILDEDFFNTYVEKYGMYDLLERYNDHLYCADDPEESPLDAAIVRQLNGRNTLIRNTIKDLQAYKDLPELIFSGTMLENNMKGYYSSYQNSKVEEEVKGAFNDSSRDNEIYEESKKMITEISYYGDWKVEHRYGYEYDEGTYEWINGEFVDEPASWNEISTFTITYRDSFSTRVNAKSIDNVNAKFKVVEGKVFEFRKNNTYYDQRIEWLAEGIKIQSSGDAAQEVIHISDDNADDTKDYSFKTAEVASDGKYVITVREIRERLAERFAKVDANVTDRTNFDNNQILGFSNGNDTTLSIYIVPKDQGYNLDSTIECFGICSTNDKSYADYYAVAANLFDETIDINYAKNKFTRLFNDTSIQDVEDGTIGFENVVLCGIEVYYTKYEDQQVCIFVYPGMDWEKAWGVINW